MGALTDRYLMPGLQINNANLYLCYVMHYQVSTIVFFLSVIHLVLYFIIALIPWHLITELEQIFAATICALFKKEIPPPGSLFLTLIILELL